MVVVSPRKDPALSGHGERLRRPGEDLAYLVLAELIFEHLGLRVELGALSIDLGAWVAQLTVLVVAPGKHVSLGVQSQHMVPSGGDLSYVGLTLLVDAADFNHAGVSRSLSVWLLRPSGAL